MNPLAAIAAAFIALQTDLRTRFNAALGKLPPLGVIDRCGKLPGKIQS